MCAFFVSGTGRCGTTILKNILGKHRDIVSFIELRFLVDKGGIDTFLRNLIDEEELRKNLFEEPDFGRNFGWKRHQVQLK